MAVMSIGKTEPQQRPLTVDDLARMPDDGRRYELIDGRLDVSPAPVRWHTRIEGRLQYHLVGLAPEGLEVLPGPGINFNADRTHHRIPDLAVAQEDNGESPYLTSPPLLAVEVVSPESVFRDHHTKKREYAEFGIESYWIISPYTDKPGIVELRLDQGSYREVGQAFGEEVFETDLPFPVKLVPRWLVENGPWKRHIGGE
ncbi:Uma2 family endonuclease [Murinocardiopsis flavida]|uniref:Uma2 family endonuclease n=1 Tax=Murinocardiopsis flavida TaxID=645275 RepID=A0A2P8DUS3_9ACTN|nr:Uma2 family endonuclease [Murinocardiopsis flavida]PSL00968.1 Uma2 family endonuclease [Murinocardiopsis flavida]